MTGLIGYYKLNEGLNHVATDQALLPPLQPFVDQTFRALAAKTIYLSQYFMFSVLEACGFLNETMKFLFQLIEV